MKKNLPSYFLQRPFLGVVSPLRLLMTALVLFSAFSVLVAQEMASGVLRIKFSEKVAHQLDAMRISKTSDGIAITGISDLDVLNRLYKAKAIQRVFPHGGKFEAKHRKHQLHLWYELRVESDEKNK